MLALIPARGGSQGIPLKNIQNLDGKPLLAWAVEAAKKSKLFKEIVVTTDSKQIAEIARCHGASVPFIRPANLATDRSPVYPSVVHAIEWMKCEEGKVFEKVMILLPTCPLRNCIDLQAANSMLEVDPDADSVVSVVRVGDPHPYKMLTVRDGLASSFLQPQGDVYYGSRQDLPPVYARNGAIYLCRIASLFIHETLLGKRILAYEMLPERSINIDEPIDLLTAQALINASKSKLSLGTKE